MIANGMKLKDHKIVVRNEPVDKKDMFYLNYQNCLIFTRRGTIKRGGNFLRNIMIYKTSRVGNIKGPLNSYMWAETFCKLIIERLSKKGGKVFDPFAASGIALRVAKQLHRKYLGCEISKAVFRNAVMNA